MFRVGSSRDRARPRQAYGWRPLVIRTWSGCWRLVPGADRPPAGPAFGSRRLCRLARVAFALRCIPPSVAERHGIFRDCTAAALGRACTEPAWPGLPGFPGCALSGWRASGAARRRVRVPIGPARPGPQPPRDARRTAAAAQVAPAAVAQAVRLARRRQQARSASRGRASPPLRHPRHFPPRPARSPLLPVPPPRTLLPDRRATCGGRAAGVFRRPRAAGRRRSGTAAAGTRTAYELAQGIRVGRAGGDPCRGLPSLR